MKKINVVLTVFVLLFGATSVVQSASKVPPAQVSVSKVPTTRAGWVLVQDGPSIPLPFVGPGAVSMPSDVYGGLAHNGAAITCAGMSSGNACSVQVSFAGTCQRYYGYGGADLDQEAISVPGTITLNGSPQNPDGPTHFNCKVGR